MKIGILTQYYPPEIGAPQARLSELAASFVSRGHEVFVLTAMPSYPIGRIYPGYGGICKKETKDGCTIIRTWVYPAKSVSMLKRVASYLSFVASSIACGVFFLPRMDYLVVESPPLFLGLSGWLLSCLKRARFVFNVSDLWPETAVRLGVLSNGWKLEAAQWLERFCYRSSWLVSGQSSEIVNAVARICPGTPTYHFSNGVNTAVFDPSRRSDAVRKELGFEGCVALYSGLHGIAQGLMQVLHAAYQLKNVEGLQFVFIGDGPDKVALKEKAKEMRLDNVRFLDPAPRNRMPEIVSAADIGLVPLKVQLPGAVPSKLYEFMGSGLPVVLAATGEPAQIVTNSKCGVVVPPDDSASLATAILNLCGDERRRTTMGRNGRLAVEAFHDRRIISQAFVEHLERKLVDREGAVEVRSAVSGER